MTAPDQFAQLPHGIRLCYRVTGEADAIPVLLVSGMSQDLTTWPQDFVDGLAAQGFRVIQHDNRDIGRSTPMTTRPPTLLHQLTGRARPDAYTLEDMAQDSVALLDHLGVRRAHLIGQSMGGMIAQTVAAHHADRVLTLTSMYSTTGAPGVGGVAWSTKAKIAKRPPHGRAEYIARHLEITAHLAGRRYLIDPVVETANASAAWERRGAAGAAGISRQIQAIQASGDRTKAVSTITAPTLVIHGDRDLIVHPSGGQATADAIAGAQLVSVPGMGHHFAPALVEPLLARITDHLNGSLGPAGRVPEERILERITDHLNGSPGPAGRVPEERSGGGVSRPAAHRLRRNARRTDNTRAVVTGAGSGIGRAFAQELARRGGQVVCADINPETAQETVSLIEAAGGSAIAVKTDVTQEHSVTALADAAQEWFGLPTLVVNNAGIGGGTPVGEGDLEAWSKLLRVNLWGAIVGCHVFLPLLRRSGHGGLINVASAAGYAAAPGMGSYNVSKSGVLTLTETIAAEIADTDLTVTALCPTFVPTNIFAGELMTPEGAVAARRLADRSGSTPESVALAALDGFDRGKLYVMPQLDAKLVWRLKRFAPAIYPTLAHKAVARTMPPAG
ncbi:hypothetical protein GCM10011492_06070 [Flexivirga endophytica]|uniref:AB hydrolase-1 domain-containing protein n=1 Tax=Flexivirga endophytica TaxID=1849103 RepID=A0A916WQ20_9MICO|nr:SDR family NAD(P)-dependent oxidoreductase [Flexivirga endophytica]GGB18982.1 hypothetical protein GCM10011492_06070 [Flexivirga endophytica]GHB36672.1 hypothetical protein GCM10008112_01530 [Flexivirga endophytica]